jgi:hypothetical protein
MLIDRAAGGGMESIGGFVTEVPGQPGITVEFELDETGAVARLVVQPLGIFLPKT